MSWKMGSHTCVFPGTGAGRFRCPSVRSALSNRMAKSDRPRCRRSAPASTAGASVASVTPQVRRAQTEPAPRSRRLIHVHTTREVVTAAEGVNLPLLPRVSFRLDREADNVDDADSSVSPRRSVSF